MPSLLETIASYVPWQIAIHLDVGSTLATQPFAKRFPAAILFVDIPEFTPLVENLTALGGPGIEELSQLLNKYFGELIETICSDGGIILRFVGDAIIAVWPTTDEKLAKARDNGLNCGFALQRKLKNYHLADRAILDPKVNVEAGEVICAQVGGHGGQWALLMAGEPFARLRDGQRNLEPGHVVVSSQTLALSGDQYRARRISENYFLLEEAQGATAAVRPNQILPSFLTTNTLRAFIPQAILSRLDAGQSEWLAEIRRVTVLFIGVSGLDYSKPAILADLQSLMGVIQDALSFYEGSLMQLVEDEKGTTIVAAFGLPPHTHEDETLRGVQAALNIQTNLKRLGFHAAIGIGTGRTFCGPIGNALRREYALYGDHVNVAARLMRITHLVGDSIYTDEPTYQAAKSGLHFQQLPAFVLKGKAAPVAAYTLVSPTTNTDGRFAMLGRQTEMGLLKEKLEALHAHASSIVVLEGEPGIGKSRLIQDLLETAHKLNLRCLSGEVEDLERATPYYVWREMVASLVGLETDVSDAYTRIASKLSQDGDILRLIPLLNTVLRLDLPDNEITSQMAGQVRSENLNTILVHLFQKEAQVMPLLLILEDAHWMDSASWTLALRLALEVQPIVIVFSLRPLADPIPSEYLRLIANPQTTRLVLNVLPTEEARALICQNLGMRSISDELATLFQDKAGGNPLFVEELCHTLLQRRIIVSVDGVGRVWPGAASPDALNLPDTLHGMITSRIDQLSPSQQMVLKMASAIGRVFQFETLRASYPIPEGVQNLALDLSALQRLDLIQPEPSAQHPAYSFKHSVIQDAVYNMMLSVQKQALHRAIAMWYERSYSDGSAPYYQILAHHWNRGGVATKAIEYFGKAGEQALHDFANEEACQCLRSATTLAAKNETSTSRRDRMRLELNLGESCVNLGNYVEGKEHIEKGLELLGYPVPHSTLKKLALLLGECFKQLSHRIWEGRYLQPSITERESLTIACRAYERLFEVYYFGNNIDLCIYSGVRLLNCAERAGSAPMIAVGYSLFGAICGYVPLRKLADAYLKRALQSVAVIEDIDAQLLTLIGVGYYYAGVGQWEVSESAFDEIVEVSRNFGHSRRLADGLNSLLYVSLFRGKYHNLVQLADMLETTVSPLRDPRYQVFALAAKAYFEIHAGDFSQAQDRLERAWGILTVHTEIGDEDQKTEISGLLALTHLRRAKFDKALEWAERTVHLTDKHSPSAYHTFFGYVGPAEVYLTLWEQRSSELQFPGLAWRACRSLRRYSRKFLIGQSKFWLMQGRYWWQSGNPAKAHKAWRTSLAVSMQMRMLGEQGLAHYEIGRHLDRGGSERNSHFRRARALFRQCGEVHFETLVNELMADEQDFSA